MEEGGQGNMPLNRDCLSLGEPSVKNGIIWEFFPNGRSEEPILLMSKDKQVLNCDVRAVSHSFAVFIVLRQNFKAYFQERNRCGACQMQNV